jgi:hypothetical protein
MEYWYWREREVDRSQAGNGADMKATNGTRKGERLTPIISNVSCIKLGLCAKFNHESRSCQMCNWIDVMNGKNKCTTLSE